MKTNSEHRPEVLEHGSYERRNESGNAMIYVLITIALFAALAFVLSRQSDNVDTISDDQASMAVTEILETSMQAKQSVDMMIYGGTRPADINFVRPADAGYNTPPDTTKLLHPSGGGFALPQLPTIAMSGQASTPAAGWYIGRFNNVGWSLSADREVIMTAFSLKEKICRTINKKLMGSDAIPNVSGSLAGQLIDARYHGAGNSDLTAASCPDCEGKPSLCVHSTGSDQYAFYSILEAR